MYVTAKAGLTQRENPSADSKALGLFLFGQMVDVHERGRKVTIGDITGYWYKTYNSNSADVWIFGGYLSKELPEDAPVILGEWEYAVPTEHAELVGDPRYYFGADGKYAVIWDDPAGGKWKLNGNVITTTSQVCVEGNCGPVATEIALLTVIDRNNIVLEYPKYQYKLKRKTKPGF